MIYRAYLDGVIFFDSSTDYDGLTLTEAEVELEAGGAGSFEFSIPPQNIAYGSFNLLTSWVSVYRDDEEIFYGRVYSISGEFNTIQTIECEGILAALNDSIVEPFTFNSTLAALVAQFLELHNAACPDIPFELGTITVEDDYVYRDYEKYEVTKNRLDDLVDSYGGYMNARHNSSADTVYLDWIEEYTDTAEQSIDFGENLVKITQESEADGIATVLIPIGATITDEDSGESYSVDITSVTDDGVNYIENEEGIAKFGRIWATNTWDDVTEPSNLLSKAQTYLNSLAQSKVTIEATAVDLANAGEDISHFAIGENIHVTSSPHGIDDDFLCTELKFDLLDPSKDELSLGKEKAGYVSTASKNLKSTTKIVEKIEANYALNDVVSALRELVETYSTSITQNAEEIELLASKVTELGEEVSENTASIAVNAEAIELKVSAADLALWLEMTEEALIIGRSNSDIHSEQDNDSYEFVDSAGNVLLRIQVDGIDATTVNVSEQVSFKSGSIDGAAEWAIRLGASNSSGLHNLNDVWIGD